MIDQQRLSKACSQSDKLVSEYGIEHWCQEYEVDAKALMHVSEQRALRVAMILDGLDPTVFEKETRVRLSQHSQSLMPLFASMYIDGLAAGLALNETSPDFPG